MENTRYGIYFTSGDKCFADAGAAWLGWDIRTATPLEAPHPEYVARPRKYGFHATLKPPFIMADGKTEAALISSTRDLAAEMVPVRLGQLTLSRIGSFFAWTCDHPNDSLQNLATATVRGLDAFRAPATEEDINKRMKPGMSEAQIRLLQTWGYPYVMECFRFHMTLTGPVPKAHASLVARLAKAHFAGSLPDEVTVDALTVVGEMPCGQFKELCRAPLRGNRSDA